MISNYFQSPAVVLNLIIINVLIFMATALLPKAGNTIMEYCALSLGTPFFHVYQIITYMFLHVNFEHIFFNMFALWMFGRTLEYELGSQRFLTFYMVCGVGAALMLFFNSPGKNPLLNFGLGLWDTYNNLTGILSDVLSYIRLFAIGLSGGILATACKAPAAGFAPEGSGIIVRLLIMIPILLIGHGINLFMSTISSFVHPMRLTFVEFYKNAGFEMSMRSFEPLQKIDYSENK